MQVYYLTLRERREDMAEERYAVLKVLPVSHLNEIDEPTLLTDGRFKALDRLSVADALIAAFAARHNAMLVHKDPEFEALENHVRQEALPYKPRVSRGGEMKWNRRDLLGVAGSLPLRLLPPAAAESSPVPGPAQQSGATRYIRWSDTKDPTGPLGEGFSGKTNSPHRAS